MRAFARHALKFLETCLVKTSFYTSKQTQKKVIAHFDFASLCTNVRSLLDFFFPFFFFNLAGESPYHTDFWERKPITSLVTIYTAKFNAKIITFCLLFVVGVRARANADKQTRHIVTPACLWFAIVYCVCVSVVSAVSSSRHKMVDISPIYVRFYADARVFLRLEFWQFAA